MGLNTEIVHLYKGVDTTLSKILLVVLQHCVNVQKLVCGRHVIRKNTFLVCLFTVDSKKIF